jgi:hypothetical protein
VPEYIQLIYVGSSLREGSRQKLSSHKDKSNFSTSLFLHVNRFIPLTCLMRGNILSHKSTLPGLDIHVHVAPCSCIEAKTAKEIYERRYVLSNCAIFSQSLKSPMTALTLGWLTRVVNHLFTLGNGARKDGSRT